MRLSGTSLIGGLGLALLVIAGPAGASDRFVAPRGTDTANDCLAASGPCRSIGHAIDEAASGDTIDVAGGRYRESVRLDSSTALTFLGGWAPGFTTRDPTVFPTTIRGRRDRTWTIEAEAGEAIDVTIDGFILTHGQSTGGASLAWLLAGTGGGGLLALGAGGSVTLAVRHSTITRNRSVIGATKLFAGGVFLGAGTFSGGSLTATFDSVAITNNRAEYAGGLYAFGTDALSLTLVNVVITGNKSRLGGGGFTVSGSGTLPTQVSIHSTTVTRNAAGIGAPRPGPLDDLTGAFSMGGQVSVALTNSILWGNRLPAGHPGPDLYMDSPGLVVDMSHTDLGNPEVEDGTLNDLGGNVSVNPQLVGSKLGPTSPVIDAGTCAGGPSTDFEGDPRPSGATCDMGADEFVP